MKNLKRNSFGKLASSVFTLFIGCAATSSFQIYRENRGKIELVVSSDRIISHCMNLEEGMKKEDKSKEGKYLLLFYVLDSVNTVVDISRSNVLDREYCFELQGKMDSIVGKSKKVYFATRGDLSDPREPSPNKHHFPKHGSFSENGLSLDLSFIKGDNGKCFGLLTGTNCEKDRKNFPNPPF